MTRVRDSGMTEETVWEGFFDTTRVLDALGVADASGEIVEFGCGYGTFTIPAARITSETIWTLDIDPAMVARTTERASVEGLDNVRAVCRDFVEEGTGRPDAGAGYAMLFNILHHERPTELIAEARRVLRPAGRLAIIHWNHDAMTPRGPDLDIRPRPEQCVTWLREAGFEPHRPEVHDLPPYHWGIVVHKPPG